MNQNQNHDIQSGGRGRRIRKSGAAALLLGGAALALTPAVAGATTGTGSSQTVTFTPSALLTVTAAATTSDLSTLTAAANHTGLPLASVSITDTLASSTPTAWTASVASSNCAPTAATLLLPQFTNLNTSAATIPYGKLTYHPGSSVTTSTALSTTPVTPTTGSSGVFSGSGSTSDPRTVATAAAGTNALDNNGVFTVSPTFDLDMTNAPAVPGGYTCTLTYTILG